MHNSILFISKLSLVTVGFFVRNVFGVTYTVKQNPVLGNAIPALGVKPKRRGDTYFGYFSR